MVIEGLLGARAVFRGRHGRKFLPGSSLARDQDAAGLRSDRLNHLKDGAHLGTVADDIVLTGETPQLAAQVAASRFRCSVSSTWRTARLNWSTRSCP